MRKYFNIKIALMLVFLVFSSSYLKAIATETSTCIVGKQEIVKITKSHANDDVYCIGNLAGSPKERILRFEIKSQNKSIYLADLYPNGAPYMGTELVNYMLNVAVKCKSQWIFLAAAKGSWAFYYKLGFRPIEKYDSITFDPKMQLSMAMSLGLLIPDSILTKKQAEFQKCAEAITILNEQYTIEPDDFLMFNGKKIITLDKKSAVIDALNRIFWNVEAPKKAKPREETGGTCCMAMGAEALRLFADIQAQGTHNPRAIRILGDQLFRNESDKLSLEPTPLTPAAAVEWVAKELGTYYLKKNSK